MSHSSAGSSIFDSYVCEFSLLYPSTTSNLHCTFRIPAERIELWVHYSPKGAATTPSSQTYEYLGFITLANNSSTNYKSRELQSIPVGPKKGTHLKLRIGAAHKTDLNANSQVALIAINVLGEDLSKDNAMPTIQTINNEPTESAIASICDDLSFSMYVEETIAEVVRKMEQKKRKAVNGKWRNLSNSGMTHDDIFTLNHLNIFTRRTIRVCPKTEIMHERIAKCWWTLGSLFVGQAASCSTGRLYDGQITQGTNWNVSNCCFRTTTDRCTARTKWGKRNVCRRLRVYFSINYFSLQFKVCPQNDAVSELYAQKPSLPSPPSLQDVASTLTTESTFASLTLSPKSIHRENSATDHASLMTRSPQINHVINSPKRGSPNTSSLRRRNRSVPRNSFEDYDEQAVPALRQ